MAAVLAAALIRADDEEVVGPLRESIAAAAIIVEGTAERPYVSWDGADPATIRTYTPFTVTGVLKGARPPPHILLRQPGGDTAGASTPVRGAEFAEGEQAIVFLGPQDLTDGSYDVSGGRRGKFVVQRDESGRSVLDVRLGADASAYGRAEKAPGTGLARVPVELFERLAAGGTIESVADSGHAGAGAYNSGRMTETSQPDQPAAQAERRAKRPELDLLFALAVLAVLGSAAWLMRRRIR